MIRNILAAFDGSKASESTLPYLEMLLSRNDANVTLVGVSPSESADDRRVIGDYLTLLAERLRRKGASVEVEVPVGDPAEEILRLAETGRYNFLALTSRGKGGLKRFLFGSVAEEILRRVTIPAFVAHPLAGGATPAPIRTILVPLDGSHRSASVLRAAADLALAHGAKLNLISIVLRTGKDELPVEVAAENLYRDQKHLKAKGLDVGLEVLFGDPAQEILTYARKHGADVIAMTTHGRTGLNRTVYGSITEKVLRKGDLPLLILRTAAIPRTKGRTPQAAKARRRVAETLKPISIEKSSHYP